MAPHVTAYPPPVPRPLTGAFDRSKVRKVAALLAGGGIALLPTDTLYGLHAASSRRDAIERIRAIKGSGARSGFILLAADRGMVDSLVSRWPGDAGAFLAAAWPAPLTALLPGRAGLPRILAPGGKVAVRVPARADLRRLAAALGEPLVSTSANLAGRPPMTRIASIRETFPGLAAYLSGRGRPPAAPSTIVDFTGPRPRLVRAGRFPWAEEG